MAQAQTPNSAITGFHDATSQHELERRFLAVPDAKLAGEHLRFLTSAPHLAGSAEDRATADYVAQKFRAAGLATEIRPYRVWLDTPQEIAVTASVNGRSVMRGPAREHVNGDPFQDDPRITPAFNSYSASGDVNAEVVYANYGRPEDFRLLHDLGISVRGRIVLIRYGQTFRGVKVRLAEENGAAGVLLYSDPADDGYLRGDAYPKGPWRPATSVQRGSVEYGFEYPGDPTTPGFASVAANEAQRVAPAGLGDLPKIPSVPLSAADARPILEALGGVTTPREWQGGLPFAYRSGGTSNLRVAMRVHHDYKLTTIWNVIGKIAGSEHPEQWVIAGNHRDAWVFGAADPSSGTAALLEAVHGVGELLKTGWRPARTIVFASWDAEEQGLIGSTEWVEENERELANAVAYFNIDTGASGPQFRACASGELKSFVREVARAVPSPSGGTVYDNWRAAPEEGDGGADIEGRNTGAAVGNLGGGSDYAAFVHHAGVPATDVRSLGDYGVYHSVFDNYEWFTRFADPGFLYTQQMARFLGVEVLRMANADVLPYDFAQYGREIANYVGRAAVDAGASLALRRADSQPALLAAHRLAVAGATMDEERDSASSRPDDSALNAALSAAEHALLLSAGLPQRPWYRHVIYAPARDSGYGAAPLPGVADAIAAGDGADAAREMSALATALSHAAKALEGATAMTIAKTRNLPFAPAVTFRQKPGGR